MKKFFLCLFLILTLINTAEASNMPDLKYKNINYKDKISYNEATGVWSKKIDKKTDNYYIKTKGFGDFSDYTDSDNNFAFSTNCEYEFIYNDRLIGYSNKNMKFYDFSYINQNLTEQELSKEEVEQIFPEYKVISMSEFSPNTNSLKIRKNSGKLNIILLNDTNNTYDNYTFSSNSKIEKYLLRGFLTINKSGMIQFSDLKESGTNWYVLLVR